MRAKSKVLVPVLLIVLSLSLIPSESFSQTPRVSDPLAQLPIQRGYTAVIATISCTVSTSPTSTSNLRRLSAQMTSIANNYNNQQSQAVMAAIPRELATTRVEPYSAEPQGRYAFTQESKIAAIIPNSQAPSLSAKIKKVAPILTRNASYTVKASVDVTLKN